jgi:hypothetical protein
VPLCATIAVTRGAEGPNRPGSGAVDPSEWIRLRFSEASYLGSDYAILMRAAPCSSSWSQPCRRGERPRCRRAAPPAPVAGVEVWCVDAMMASEGRKAVASDNLKDGIASPTAESCLGAPSTDGLLASGRHIAHDRATRGLGTCGSGRPQPVEPACVLDHDAAVHAVSWTGCIGTAHCTGAARWG